VTDPEFLEIDDVLLLHDEQLIRYGGGAGVRDPGILDAAVAAPRATFEGRLLHPDLFHVAAAYAFHIAQGQPFIDGNKRAGLAAALVFLELNGVSVADPHGELYRAMLDIAQHRLDIAGLASLLQSLPHGSD
jgi:death-on-curing protein